MGMVLPWFGYAMSPHICVVSTWSLGGNAVLRDCETLGAWCQLVDMGHRVVLRGY